MTNIKLTKNNYLKYLNSFKSSYFYVKYDKKTKISQKVTIKYGNWIKRHQPVAFEKGFNDWIIKNLNKNDNRI